MSHSTVGLGYHCQDMQNDNIIYFCMHLVWHRSSDHKGQNIWLSLLFSNLKGIMCGCPWLQKRALSSFQSAIHRTSVWTSEPWADSHKSVSVWLQLQPIEFTVTLRGGMGHGRQAAFINGCDSLVLNVLYTDIDRTWTMAEEDDTKIRILQSLRGKICKSDELLDYIQSLRVERGIKSDRHKKKRGAVRTRIHSGRETVTTCLTLEALLTMLANNITKCVWHNSVPN